MTSQEPPERPDLIRVQRELRILIAVIVVVVVGVLSLTAYLYQRFTSGVTVTP